MIQSLQALADNRDALLLAEVAALMHDWQKCIDMAVASNWRLNSHISSEKIRDWEQRGRSLRPGDFAEVLAEISLSLQNESIDLKTLCQEGKDPSSAKNHRHLLVQLLGKCHAFAHVDKELEINEQKDQACDRISTAFGFEPIEPDGLLNPLLSTVKPMLNDWSYSGRTELLSGIQRVFSNAWGDTRRPINEVTLSDWGYIVSALYKSSLAGHLLKVNPTRWCILRVNFDVLGLYAKAVKIADLMGYQDVVKEACAAVKQLVEEEYPLGNEIYRDTTGIYFTFPDIDLPADLPEEIRRRVEEVEPELAPYIAVEKPSGNTPTEQLKRMLAEGRRKALADLAQPFSQDNLNSCWQALWNNLPKDGKWEVCPVCRLRPKREEDEVCEVCDKRRQSRIEWWESHPQQTIWMDEIADHNGRVALLVGKFGLEDWLSGDLVQTMLVKAVEGKPDECQPKNPSPARLRRVWETCQRFWEETVEKKILNNLSERKRWILNVGALPSSMPEGTVCDGTLNGQPISVWRQGDQLLTISFVDERPLGQLSVSWEKGEQDKKRKFELSRQIIEARQAGDEFSSYRPFLTLPPSPDQFLALVPASEALEIAQKIEQAYREQMGKVQNRLPLFLGLVFFQRKTPLMAAMDTARRMLEGVSLTTEQWEIAEDVQNGAVKFTNGFEWKVPTVMGDGSTEDVWYPYWQMEGTPTDRRRWFVGPDGEHWVHVNELRKGDKVGVTPSRFAYLFLESTAQRFRFDSQREVLLLDDLQRLRDLWKAICTSPEMTDSKLQAIAALFEQKCQEWDLPFPTPQNPITDETFRHLVKTTLKRDNVQIGPEEVLNGHFQRTVDLHLHILKRRVKDFQQKGGSNDQPNA